MLLRGFECKGVVCRPGLVLVTRADRAMRKHEMAQAIARETSITSSQALAAMDTLTTLIIETVARGERVTLRDLGYFDSREWKGHTVKNKFLDNAFSIPSHRVPTFHPSGKFRKAVRR
jgi:DNA-binding protein HU-beta